MKLLIESARQLGEKVVVLSQEDREDIASGIFMKKVKTGQSVGWEEIMQKPEREWKSFLINPYFYQYLTSGGTRKKDGGLHPISSGTKYW
ncbi:MAG: hypothetical protein FWF54_07445 [Candidatus Azobacteroides sp.]|nr:hypothetical protein [Candidatus Azobacteroides sp.]